MRVEVHRKFLKDLAKLPTQERQKIEHFVFEESGQLTSIEDDRRFKKLQGFSTFYRARFGDYRVGVRYESNTLIFERVLHRKDIYRYFP